METKDGNKLMGWIAEKPRVSDYKIEFSGEQHPKSVDLRADCTPVENQGKINSCTANAVVGALEYHLQHRDGGVATDLSRMFVYYNTRRLRGSVQQDTGATISEAMAAVLAYGACRANIWPYDPQLFYQEPPQQAYQDARQYEAIQYARVAGMGGAISALAQGFPVVFGTYLPSRCYDEAAQTGIMPATTQEERSAQPSGGHAMLLIGYDLDEKMFLIRNSWGTQWANQGYCKCPFDEIGYFSPQDSFWTMLKIESPGNYSLIRPSQQASTPAKQATEFQKSSGLAETAANLRQQISGDLKAGIDAASDRVDKLLSTRTGVDEAAAHSTSNTAYGGVCSNCNGSGSCWYCGGKGQDLDYQCGICNGTGKCTVCSGTGKVIS